MVVTWARLLAREVVIEGEVPVDSRGVADEAC